MSNEPESSAEQHAAEQAAANAALSGSELQDDVRELLERKRTGELAHDEFVAQVVQLVKSRPPATDQERAVLEQQSFERVDHISQADADAMSSRLAATAAAMDQLSQPTEERP